MTNDNQTLLNIISASGNEYSQNTIDVFLCIVDKHDHSIDDGSPDEVIEALEAIEQGIGLDWLFSFDGNEYRIIPESIVDDVYTDAIEDLISDCYPEVEKAGEHWIFRTN